jgi:hypothetical protein
MKAGVPFDSAFDNVRLVPELDVGRYDTAHHIAPVFVAFTGVGDDPAIGGVQIPSPLVRGVFVELEVHRAGPFMAESYPTFLFEYRHDGADWAIKIPGRDAEDAPTHQVARLGTLQGRSPGTRAGRDRLLRANRGLAEEHPANRLDESGVVAESRTST